MSIYSGLSMTIAEVAAEVGGSIEEAVFALDLLVQRQMYRQANIQMAAIEAATGNGRIPKAWFRAITTTEDEASQLAFDVNSERLARKVWGQKR